MNKKLKYILLILVVFLSLLFIVLRLRNNNSDYWQLGNPNTVYTIQGTNNYGRESTFYLYNKSSGNRDLILVDPDSPVDFTHLTDREVIITGKLISKNGKKMVRITWVGLAN